MADLVADISEAEQRTIQAQKESSQSPYHPASPDVSHFSGTATPGYGANVIATSMSQYEDDLPPPPEDPMLDLPLPPPPPEPLSQVRAWSRDGRTSATHHFYFLQSESDIHNFVPQKL